MYGAGEYDIGFGLDAFQTLWSVSPRPSLRSLLQPLRPLLPRKAIRKKMRAQMAFLMEMVTEGRRKQELGLYREISWIWSDLMPHAKSKRVGCHQALPSTKSSPAGNRRDQQTEAE